MGVKPLPRIKLYWSKNETYENKRIRKSLKQDRFYAILKFLHFADKEISIKQKRMQLFLEKKLLKTRACAMEIKIIV